MFHVSVGGMQLGHWTNYFPMIRMTLRVLKTAGIAFGCGYADIFKRVGVYFAVSIWTQRAEMKAFAHTGVHVEFMACAPELMKMFHTHSYGTQDRPVRDEVVQEWRMATGN